MAIILLSFVLTVLLMGCNDPPFNLRVTSTDPCAIAWEYNKNPESYHIYITKENPISGEYETEWEEIGTTNQKSYTWDTECNSLLEEGEECVWVKVGAKQREPSPILYSNYILLWCRQEQLEAPDTPRFIPGDTCGFSWNDNSGSEEGFRVWAKRSEYGEDAWTYDPSQTPQEAGYSLLGEVDTNVTNLYLRITCCELFWESGLITGEGEYMSIMVEAYKGSVRSFSDVTISNFGKRVGGCPE